eukprot:COSAG06_NODE_3385_length_5423_cov_22.051841_1_plen_91_part_00
MVSHHAHVLVTHRHTEPQEVVKHCHAELPGGALPDQPLLLCFSLSSIHLGACIFIVLRTRLVHAVYSIRMVLFIVPSAQVTTGYKGDRGL